MTRRKDEWDEKFMHYHRTWQDDEAEGIRRCASCSRPIVIGAECMNCAMEHPVTAAVGWLGYFAKKLSGDR